MISSKVLRVARTEYLNYVRTKAFIIAVILMPVLMGGSVVVNALVKDSKDLRERRIAVSDGTGKLAGYLEQAFSDRNEHAIWDDSSGERVQIDSKWVVETTDEDSSALSKRIRDEEIFAYVLIDPDVVEVGSEGRIAYHTNTPTYEALPAFLGGTLNREIQRLRFEGQPIDQGTVRQLTQAVPVRRYGLVSTNTSTGKIEAAKEVDRKSTILVPLAALMLLFMLVMMSGPQLMNNVLEEKMQRISEVLVSSVSPFELFLGKLIGSAFVSWSLAVIYLGGIAFLGGQFGFDDLFEPTLFLWFLAFQLAAMFIFGSIFMALGAACSELRDAQSLMTPAMLLVMIPLFTWMVVIESPDGAFAVGLSIFPTTAPFIMLIRLATQPGPAVWELIASLVSMTVFTIACVWAAGRIFRVGILSQGQAPGFGRLLSWIFVK